MTLKKWLLSTLILWIASAPYLSFWANSNVFEVYQLIDTTLKLKSATLTSDIPYSTIIEAFEKSCPIEAINEAKKDLPTLQNAWWSSVSTNKNKVLKERFDTIKDLISWVKKDNESEFCKQQYTLFSLLRTTQELYNWKKTLTVEKKSVLTEKNEHSSANNKWFRFVHDPSWLPTNIRSSFSKATENYLQSTLADMLVRHILDDKDIKTLNNKIVVSYVQSCEVTEWNFRAVKNLTTNEVSFKDITLIISYCKSNNTAQRNERHVRQILAHELGHYIYFFKDKNPSSFSEICWNKWVMNCLPSEFVSKYATKSVEEDYAESFAFWYLDASDNKEHGSAPYNEPMNRRERHFERLFEEEEEDDDDDENNN